MKAFFETVRDGLVPVIVKRVQAGPMNGTIIMRVTETHGAYRKGYTFESNGLHVFPPTHVRRTQFSTYVRRYNWLQHAA